MLLVEVMGRVYTANRFWVVRCSDFDAEYVEKKRAFLSDGKGSET